MSSRISIPIIAVILLLLPGRTDKAGIGSIVSEKDTIRCEFVMDRSVYKKTNPIGFHYEIISRYADRAEKTAIITPGDSLTWDRFLKDSIDFVICSPDQQYPKAVLMNSICRKGSAPVFEHIMMHRNQDSLNFSFNRWYSIFSKTEEYRQLIRKYYRNFQNRRVSLGMISPYDDIIRKYSTEFGWDWKFIAAIIQKESKFFMGAESHRGAIGLMQIKQSTADRYGISNLFDPENNVKAGVMFLTSIAKRMQAAGIPENELYNFTLAAFNAGEGRIEDCRNFARSQHRNPNSWDEIVSIIPLMREEEHYTGEHIKLGKFKGTETIDYVEEVQKIYQKYKALP